MSNALTLSVDIEMTTRAKQAASRMRILGASLSAASHDLRRSGNLAGLSKTQSIIAQINIQHSIIAVEKEKAEAKIAAARHGISAHNNSDIIA